MDKPLDMPGPGENGELANVPGEPCGRPIPVGDITADKPAADPRRVTHELTAVDRREGEQTPDYDPRQPKRRTSTEQDALGPICPQDTLSEQRLDRSAHDLHRESAFDSVPDDAGPHGD